MTLPAPAPEVVAAASVVTPNAVAGSYRLTAAIQSRRRTASGRQGGLVQLSSTLTAAPMADAPSASQFNATVALSGYTQAPRGRPGQSAAWWPIGGDSVVVQFATANSAQIQLRGLLRGGTIRGEIWYLSMASGSALQMGTFVATKGR